MGRSAQGFLQGFQLGAGRVELALPNGQSVGAGGSGLVVEGDSVGGSGQEPGILGNGLVDQGVTFGQPVDLDRPISLQHIVHLLDVPARLSVGGVELGQMDAVVLHTLCARDHKGPYALSVVLEVIGQGLHAAICAGFQTLVPVLHQAQIVEVGGSLTLM